MDGQLRTYMSLRKRWSLGSIVEEVKYLKDLKKSNTIAFSESYTKIMKQEYFPARRGNLKKNLSEMLVINPDSGFKTLWDLIVFFPLIFKLFIIPYEIAFESHLVDISKEGLLITDILFLLDILIRFNVGYHFKGFLMTNRLLISKNYLKSFFFIDLLASIPFQNLIDFESYSQTYELFGIQYLKLILLVKLTHIYRIKQTIYQLEDKFTSIHSVTFFKFLHLSLLIFLMIHWTSCVSYLFLLRDSSKSYFFWIHYIQESGFAYLNYMYYILFTVTSIGYYALNTITMDQIFLNILIMSLDIIIFAYILGKIESTLNSYQKENNETKRLLSQCKFFFTQNKIPRVLRQRILKYLIFCREHGRKMIDKEGEILGNLSKPLREEIFTITRGHIINQNKIFKMYNLTFKRLLGSHLKLQIFGPHDSIFESGENSSNMYFIQAGQVEIFHLQTFTTFKLLNTGKHFGEIAFFLGTTRVASARSVFFSEVLSLSRKVLNGLLCCRPAEKNMTDQLITETLENGLSCLHIRCYFCKKQGHIAANCRSYVIIPKRRQESKLLHLSNPSKSKKVNPNNQLFTFQGDSTHSSRPRKIVRSKKPFDLDKVFVNKPDIISKAQNFYAKEKTRPEKKRIFCDVDSEDESSESYESSPLPRYMQYRRSFLEVSKKHRKVQLFDNGDFPKIYLSSPPIDDCNK